LFIQSVIAQNVPSGLHTKSRTDHSSKIALSMRLRIRTKCSTDVSSICQKLWHQFHITDP